MKTSTGTCLASCEVLLPSHGPELYKVTHRTFGVRVLTRPEVDALLEGHREAIGTDTYDVLMDAVRGR